jgi:hypothetical protein
VRFIIGKHIDEWRAAFNPIFDQARSQPQVHQGPVFATADKSLTQCSVKDWALGGELYTNVNQVSSTNCLSQYEQCRLRHDVLTMASRLLFRLVSAKALVTMQIKER